METHTGQRFRQDTGYFHFIFAGSGSRSRDEVIWISTFKMTRSAAFVVVVVLLWIVPPATASDVLRCTGKRQSDGQFYFNMTYDLKEGVDDCETQWVINGSVVGISEADGNTECMLPLLKATANTAILQTCHEKLECLLICPSASIYEKEPCSCNITSPTTLPEEESRTGSERHEVGFLDWSVGVWIGVSASVILLVSVIVTIVLYKKKQRSGYAPGPAEEIV